MQLMNCSCSVSYYRKSSNKRLRHLFQISEKTGGAYSKGGGALI